MYLSADCRPIPCWHCPFDAPPFWMLTVDECKSHFSGAHGMTFPEPRVRSLRVVVRETPAPETADVVKAIRQWLQWGEDAYARDEQGGYFSGGGWAAVMLRGHLAALEVEAGLPLTRHPIAPPLAVDAVRQRVE